MMFESFNIYSIDQATDTHAVPVLKWCCSSQKDAMATELKPSTVSADRHLGART
jgi:hypothetical protein